MSRTSTLHATAAALGVLAGFALAPDGAPPLDRDVTPYAVAVAWNAPEPPVQVLRIRYVDEGAPSAVTPAVLGSPAPAAHPDGQSPPYLTKAAVGGAKSAESPAADIAGGADAVDGLIPVSRACPERSRRASARLRQS